MLRSAPLMLSILLVLLLLQQTTSHLRSGPHIADVNILLPPKMTHPVEYRLQGSHGCFKWSWDHHDILSVLPEYNSSSHCSHSARLKSIASYGGRKETAVYATDLNTGMMIRCKVYIDSISRIQIFHNSVKLDLDGLATLRVRAFDSEENVFSSLVGLQFMWQMIPQNDGFPHHLIHVPLKDSPLSDCGGLCGDLDIQVKLEESSVYSDLCVVKGTEIGHEIVSVHLLEPSLQHLSDKIILTVAEAMSLDPPSPVFVLAGAIVNYNLTVIRSNSPQLVSLPSKFHQWSVLNTSVAEVDIETGKAHALNMGSTTVFVEDTRVDGHVQTSSLHVVLPDSLMLFISPLSGTEPVTSVSRWYVVSGRQYLIQVKVFSSGREIYITENDDIELYDGNYEFWDTLPFSDAKKNYRILNANSHGAGKLTATLAYTSGHDTRKELLKVVQEVTVCNRVKFETQGQNSLSGTVLLPWAPGVYQEFELKAFGGCGMSSDDYKWFSSDKAVVSVSASGVLQAKKPGKATVRAVSVYDSLNFDEIIVEVSFPSSIIMLPDFPVEIPVGTHLQASVTFKAPNGAYFHACDAFRSSVRWKTESESFSIVNQTMDLVEIRSSNYGPPCSWTHIYASNSGRTVVHTTLTKESQHFDQTNSGSIALKTSSYIAAYSPLIVLQASDGNQFGGYWSDLTNSLDDLYLTPGTQLDLTLIGGPKRWGPDVEFIQTVEILDEQNFNVKDRVHIHQLAGNLYRVGCEGFGAFKLVLRRGNLIGKDHPLPSIAEVQLSLVCTIPSSIVIVADEDLNAPNVLRSARVRASPITVSNGRRIRVSSVGISDSGKAFANSSSLMLKWELFECDGLVFLDDAYTSSAAKSSWERFFTLRNTSGLCTIRSSVVGSTYSSNHLDFSNLHDSIQLQLVSSLVINPDFSLLFFSSDARLNLSITGGSSFLDIAINDTQIVEVIKENPAYSQLILAPKNLGSAVVTVHDIGVVPPLAASSTVQVADVDWIKITTGNHISVVRGSVHSITFLAGVNDGRSFDPSQYVYMNIRVHIDENIVHLVDNYSPNFTIKGTHLGVTTVYLSATQHSGHEIQSQKVTIEVYAPPRIHPTELFLVPGASYVLTVRGGPRIGSRAQYNIMDGQSQTAQIEKSSGRILAISSGNSTVVATIYGNGDTVLCEAYAKVKVGIPSSAVVNVQSERIAIGCSMRIHPSLSEGNLFSFYRLCKNFKWGVGEKGVVSFEEEKRASDTEKDYFDLIKVVHGVSAGKANVTVSFTCDFKSSNSVSKLVSYSASIILRVVPDLPLSLGSSITWILPPHYTSSDLLPSQGDKGIIAYSLLGQCKKDSAIYIDGSKIATKDSDNLACIQAKDRSTGRIEIACCVKIAEVAQVRVTTDEFPVHTLLVGAELDFPIKYYDSLGNPFHEANNVTLFESETNDPDVVSVDTSNGSGSIHLRAKSQGTALVKIASESNPRISDYVIIYVGSDNPQLYPQLERNSLLVDAPKGDALTNAPLPVKGYPFSVKLGDKNNKVLSFDCAVDPLYIGFVKPWIDLETGHSYCLFFPYSPQHLARSNHEQQQHVYVSVTASLKGNRSISGSASALFIKGFTILEMNENSPYLNMNSNSNKRVITIVGNPDVEISWEDKYRLSVTPLHGGVNNHVQYEIKILGSERLKDRIIISLPATNHSIEVDVSFEPDEQKAAVKEGNLTLWASVASLFFLLILTVTLVIYCLDRPDRLHSPPLIASGTPSVLAPVTPERTIPAAVNEQSPRTPQPFIEYVRRTIDETPYYRQDFRRRVNPQNTF